VFPASVIAESPGFQSDKHINFFDRRFIVLHIPFPEPPYYHSYQRRSLSQGRRNIVGGIVQLVSVHHLNASFKLFVRLYYRGHRVKFRPRVSYTPQPRVFWVPASDSHFSPENSGIPCVRLQTRLYSNQINRRCPLRQYQYRRPYLRRRLPVYAVFSFTAFRLTLPKPISVGLAYDVTAGR
jgi:hypothetical protein